MMECRNKVSSAHLSQARSERRGVILVIVLVVIVVLSLSAYSFTALMIAQREAALLSGRQIQTRALVDSGLESVRLFLSQDEASQLGEGGSYDNATLFQGVVVVDDEDPDLRGRFTVVAPALDTEGQYAGIRYGLEDESTRLNLNALLLVDEQMENAGRQLLMGLPGMTEEIADAILDWIDEDDEVRDLGAEVEYYSGLDPPYAPKNGLLETVEELLLVRGITPQILFGLDVNRNGMLESYESSNSSGIEFSGLNTDNSDGSLNRGWSAYLTLYSQENNATSEGAPRVYINSDDLERLFSELQSALDEQWATFIVAYRQNGPYTGNDEPSESANGTLNLSQPAQFPFVQVLDIVGQKVRVTFQNAERPTILASPVQPETIALQLPLLMDKLTTNESATIPGRININQAPRAILAGIPGMEEEIVNEIVSRRELAPTEQDDNRKHETWILAEGLVDLDQMRALLPFINVGGDVYRGQIVGYLQGGGAASRAEVVFDATAATPRILFWRDISHLGRGFSLETLGVDLVQ